MPITLAAVESISPRDIGSSGQQPEQIAGVQQRIPHSQGGVGRVVASSSLTSSTPSVPVMRTRDAMQSYGREGYSAIEKTSDSTRSGSKSSVVRSGSKSSAVRSKSSLLQVASPSDDLDWSSSIDADDPFASSHVFGRGHQASNIGALKPMQNLEIQHQHNPNLVRQFEELTKTFKAWRPVRGDGNCYYRAVIFSWLERSIGLNLIDDLQKFDQMLWPLRNLTTLTVSARLCHEILKSWIQKRRECKSETEVKTLLLEVGDEFNKTRSDLAFIQCLRYFVADYLQRNAHMSVSSGSDVLTYETWAVAISNPEDNINNIRDFCNNKVSVMGVDAADHVLHVCPIILSTSVRICMVDRDSTECTFIDYGECTKIQQTGIKSSGNLTESAFSSGGQPEIYLLLKPGHYDVLLPMGDGLARLLGPESHEMRGQPSGASPTAQPHDFFSNAGQKVSEAETHLRRVCDVRWKSLIHLMNNICEAYKAAMHCMEEKLVEELAAKKKRLGSCDEIVFETMLRSVVDPLVEYLKEFNCVPDDSPFGQEKQLSRDSFELPHLLPRMHDFFDAGNPSRSKAAPIHVQTDASKLAPSASSAVNKPPLKLAAVASASSGRSTECCICLCSGATVVAPCSCAYHANCFKEYVEDEMKSGNKGLEAICCHVHEKNLGVDFLSQHFPGSSWQAPKTNCNLNAVVGAVATQRQLGDLIRNPPSFDHTRRHNAFGNELDISMVDVRHGSSAVRQAPPPALMSVSPALQMFSTSKSIRRDSTGNIGGAFGVPCVLCFGEDGALKTLHCGAKVHSSCLRDFWFSRVTKVCRLTHIACPATESTGCKDYLSDLDIRGVVNKEDIAAAEKQIQKLDAQSQALIAELKRQDEEYRPMFQCAICLTEHDVEGCCTLPCNHRFCFESLEHHFGYIVKERRLNKLICPVEDCGFDLRSEEHIHIFHQCLPSETYHKLLDFLSRDLQQIRDCRHLGCEERVFVDDDDDPADLQCKYGHRFCANCNNGPHPRMTCEARQKQIDKQRKDEHSRKDDEAAWRNAMASGWKPCPMRCSFGGGFKASEECDHVTCQCGFEFCWDCGVQRQIPLAHDNRWHKPSCRYHTKPEEVQERPRYSSSCPQCTKGSLFWTACAFPEDDGYPESYCKPCG